MRASSVRTVSGVPFTSLRRSSGHLLGRRPRTQKADGFRGAQRGVAKRLPGLDDTMLVRPGPGPELVQPQPHVEYLMALRSRVTSHLGNRDSRLVLAL